MSYLLHCMAKSQKHLMITVLFYAANNFWSLFKGSSEHLTGHIMHMSVVQNVQINMLKLIAYLHIITKELGYHIFHGCFHN